MTTCLMVAEPVVDGLRLNQDSSESWWVEIGSGVALKEQEKCLLGEFFLLDEADRPKEIFMSRNGLREFVGERMAAKGLPIVFVAQTLVSNLFAS